MTSDRPLLPLALALPRMLQEIEAALATAGPAEARRLRQRATSAAGEEAGPYVVARIVRRCQRRSYLGDVTSLSGRKR